MKMTIPGFIEFSELNLFFVKLQSRAREVFRDGVCIESVYGGVPGSKFCGGRGTVGKSWLGGDVVSLIEEYNGYGVGCNVTYTNQFIDKAALEQSTFSMGLLDALNQLSSSKAVNGVIIYADVLNAYLRENLPALRRILSTTREIVAEDQIRSALAEYDRVVVSYNLTREESLLKSLSSAGGLEVMVNEYCTPGCPNRNRHYRQISIDQIRGVQSPFACAFADMMPPQAHGFLSGLIDGDVFLRNEEVRRYHDHLGIDSFKIVGRGLALYDVIDSYLYYLIKPEYWNEVRDSLVHSDIL